MRFDYLPQINISFKTIGLFNQFEVLITQSGRSILFLASSLFNHNRIKNSEIMKKTILLLILIPLFLHQESKAQHFIASFGVQHSWNVPMAITGQIYDHFYDYNWVHADRVWTPRGDDFLIILQRNDLFAEVEIGWNGIIRHVEYFDYYPLDQHVCDDFCGFHQPFYNTFYSPNRFVFDYGISYVYYSPRIRVTYCHPYRFTRRPRYVNVYSPFRFRRNYTRVFRRIDHYDHSHRYGRNRSFHYSGNAQRAGRSSNYRNSNADRSSNGRTYGDRTSTRQNDSQTSGRQSNVNRTTDRSVNRNITNDRTGSTRQSTRSSDYNGNSRVSSGTSDSRSSVGRSSSSGSSRSYTPRTENSRSSSGRSDVSGQSSGRSSSSSVNNRSGYIPRSGTNRSSSVSRGNSSSGSTTTRANSSGSTNRSSSSVNSRSNSRTSESRTSESRNSVKSSSARGSGSRSSGRSGSSSGSSKNSSSRSRSRGS